MSQNAKKARAPTDQLVLPLLKFYKDSVHLLNKCEKPDFNEWMKLARIIAVGFLIMGFIGFAVKAVFIPINHLLIGV